MSKSFFRLPGEGSDLPVMIWDAGDLLVIQIGRKRPIDSGRNFREFATFVTDHMWTCEPVTELQYHAAMDCGLWPDHKSSMEQTS